MLRHRAPRRQTESQVEGQMEKRKKEQEKLSESLAKCESRLEELKGQAEGKKLLGGLGALEDKLKSCRLKVDELEDKSEDDWLDAKYSVTKEIDDLQRSLQLSPDQMEDFIR
jgi:predicted nuclease with TOPRIM domain